MSAEPTLSAATVAECLALLADGETLVAMPDGRWLLSSVVDLRVACPTAASIAHEIIDKGYVSELSRRSFRGSAAEYDITPAGEAATRALRQIDRRPRHEPGGRRRAAPAQIRR
jgi:hypothetical protein